MDDVVRQLVLKHLQKSEVVVGDMLIEKRRGKILGSKVNCTCYKEKLQCNVIAFIDCKITCYKVGGFHASRDIGTLGSRSTCNIL